MHRCLTYFVCEDGKFIKGAVYGRLPNNTKYHGLFIELETPKKRVEVQEKEVETASIKPKRGRPKKK